MSKVINFNNINENKLNTNNKKKLNELKNKINDNNLYSKKVALSFGLVDSGLFNPFLQDIGDIDVNDFTLEQILNIVPEKLKPIFTNDIDDIKCMELVLEYIVDDLNNIFDNTSEKINEDKLKNYKCPLCDSENVKIEKDLILPNYMYAASCNDCGTQFMVTTNEELDKIMTKFNKLFFRE